MIGGPSFDPHRPRHVHELAVVVVSADVPGYGGFAARRLHRRSVRTPAVFGLTRRSGRLRRGGFADDGTLLIATRFIKGVSGIYAPAGLSIITTSFAEGTARNKAISIYTATGATGFSPGSSSAVS